MSERPRWSLSDSSDDDCMSTVWRKAPDSKPSKKSTLLDLSSKSLNESSDEGSSEILKSIQKIVADNNSSVPFHVDSSIEDFDYGISPSQKNNCEKVLVLSDSDDTKSSDGLDSKKETSVLRVQQSPRKDTESSDLQQQHESILSDLNNGDDLNEAVIVLSDTEGSLDISKSSNSFIKETFPRHVDEFLEGEIGRDNAIDRLPNTPLPNPGLLHEYTELSSSPSCQDLPGRNQKEMNDSNGDSSDELDDSVDSFEERHKSNIFVKGMTVLNEPRTKKNSDAEIEMTVSSSSDSASSPSKNSKAKKSGQNSNVVVKTSRTRKCNNDSDVTAKRVKLPNQEPSKRSHKTTSKIKVLDKETIALRERKKALRLNCCIEYVTCRIDETILSSQNISIDILKRTYMDINFQALNFDYPCVKWCRTLPNGDRDPIVEVPPHMYFFFAAEDFVSGLLDSGQAKKVKSKSFKHFMESHKPEPGFWYHIICFGMAKYKTKLKKQRSSASKTKHPSILEIDRAIVKFEFKMKMDVLYVEESNAFMTMLLQLTKAIAEEPYKTATKSRYIKSISNVKVLDEKSARMCWKSMLCRLNNVSADIATAIAAVYGTPVELMQAYKRLPSIQEREELLASITVRRGVGSLETNRRVGKEMSKRLHAFFTSRNGEEILL